MQHHFYAFSSSFLTMLRSDVRMDSSLRWEDKKDRGTAKEVIRWSIMVPFLKLVWSLGSPIPRREAIPKPRLEACFLFVIPDRMLPTTVFMTATKRFNVAPQLEDSGPERVSRRRTKSGPFELYTQSMKPLERLTRRVIRFRIL